MTKDTKKSVTKKQDHAVSTNVIDMSADAGKGLENADKDSFAIPYLQILQAQSPQVDEVKDAKSGMFINTITNELFEECLIIPCGYQRRYLAWASRESGGGLKGTYSPIEVESNHIGGVSKNEKGQYMLGEYELSDTRIHYCLVKCADGSWQPVVLSLSKTQVKKSKIWMALIQGLRLKDADEVEFNPASFSHIYKLTTVKEKNDKGTWNGVKLEIVEPVSNAQLYNNAKLFAEQAIEGEVKVQEPAEDAPF